MFNSQSPHAPSDRSRGSLFRFSFPPNCWLFVLALLLGSVASVSAASSIVGPTTICNGSTNLYSVATDSTNNVYAWSIGTNNPAGAVILGDTNTASVVIQTSGSGEFVIECLVDFGTTNELAFTNVLVLGLIGGSGLTNQIACPGDSVTFGSAITGSSNYTVLWRKDGDVIAGATGDFLTLTNISVTNAGTYCMEVTGLCNSFTNCATLTLVPLAGLACPTNLLLQCWSEVPPPDTNSIVATNAILVLFLGDLAVTNGCEITISRTYGAVNSCGQTSTCSQVFTVQDTTPPAFACPTNLIVELGAPWDFDVPTVIDNCAGTNVTLLISGTITNPLCGQTYAATRTWLAYDACSNVAFCSQTITVVDTVPPVFAGSSNLVFQVGVAWDFDPPVPTDNADGTNVVLTIVNTLTNPICGNSYQAIRVWTATDTCSNVSAFSQTVSVVDTTPPVINCVSNRIVEYGSAWDFDLPTAFDVADGSNAVIVVFSTITNADCGNTFTATRTWQAIDSCTNVSTCSQTIFVKDTTAPALACNTNRIVEFGTTWDFDTPGVSDVADGTNVAVVVLGTITNAACGNTYSATRTWQATDSCTNISTCNQTIFVVDTTPPVFVGASNLLVQLGDPWDFNPPSVTDIADGTNLVMTVTDTLTNLICGSSYQAIRIWTATDSCSNVAAFSQTVSVLDTTPPVIACVTNQVVEYGSAWDFGFPSAFDAVDGTNVIITVVSTITNADCGNTFTATRTWQAVDSCTNISTCSQTVFVKDTTPPVLVGVSNLVVQLGDPWDFNPPSVTDIADGTNVTVTVADTLTNLICGSSYQAIRIWVATDSCSNIAAFSQTVLVLDTTPPVIACVTNQVVEYGSAWDFGSPSAFDAIDGTNVIITVVSTITNADCGNTFIATRTWQAVDSCTNISTCSQTIFVKDTTPPVFVGVSNVVVQLGNPWDFNPPSVTDIADGTNVVMTITDTLTNLICGSSYQAIRIWTATDSCSNVAAFSQTVLVLDTTPPVIACLTNQVVEFGSAWDFGFPTAFDAIDGTNVIITVLSTVTNADCGNTFVATRTWQAVDSCTNISTCSQTFFVKDTTPPVLACGTNRIVEFGTPWDFDFPGVSDIADGTNVVVVVLNTITNADCGNAFTATRTWQATDSCTNSSTCSQTIFVKDTTPPALACNTNRIIECGTAWDFDVPGVFDVADGTNVVIVVLGTITNADCGNTFTATRTWQATDSCTNISTCSQTIFVKDTTPPVLICGTNRFVECGSGWDFDPPTVVTDVCGGTNVLLEIVGTVTNHLIGETFSATRTWKATDACTNSITCSQTITIIDVTPPVIFCPTNAVVECAGPPGTPVLFSFIALDACDTNVTLVAVPPSGSFFPLGTNVVICTATDDSGNSNQCTFTITVIDTTAPQIICPTNLIVAESPRDSGGAVVTFSTIASDVCDSVPGVVSVPASGSIFTNGYTLVQNTVTDGSGNTNACAFTIRVIPYRLYVLNTNDSGPGSLREAILDANASPDANLVLFNLPPLASHLIQPLSPLPEITSPVTIDGWSQPGFTNAPVVEISGSLAGAGVDGLSLTASSNTIRGLVLNGFATAIRMATNGGNIIQGNFIGSDATGVVAMPNGNGIVITSPNNLIGGTNGNAANLISGNSSNGIVLATMFAHHNVIRGNHIGTTPAGLLLGNGQSGIFATDQANNNLLGEGNHIAFNGGKGVALSASAGYRNAIVGNSIHANASLGIDLGADGLTPNDIDDPDAGPNRLQNFPILYDVTFSAGITVVSGTLNSMPSQTYRIEFYLNAPGSPAYGEGKTLIGVLDQFVHSDGNGDFTVPFVVPATYLQYVTATATDPDGNTSEYSPPTQVTTPPVLEGQPTNTVFIAGTNIILCVNASGTPPIRYQWRLNGQNIPNATNACYTVPGAQATNSGSYVCVIINGLGASGTTPATWLLSLPSFPAGDNYANRVKLEDVEGRITGSTLLATREPGEPLHAGKPGARSVWYRWTAPFTGLMTMGTTGSDFDTLLAVYRLPAGKYPSVTNLVVVANDEDMGGYFTSDIWFNVVAGQEYAIAIDGFSGEAGSYAFNWDFETTGYLLPAIWTHPASQTVLPGTNANFSVVAVRVCSFGHENCAIRRHYPNNVIPVLEYQWLFNGVVIPGKTNVNLTIPIVDEQSVGNYSVTVKMTNRKIRSHEASLQINQTEVGLQTIQVFDKLQDALGSKPLYLGTGEPPPGPNGVPHPNAIIVAGYSGSQVFNTIAGTSQGEIFCGVVGGSSEWLNFAPLQTGVLSVNTVGSSFDTLLAVIQSNSPPTLLGCNDNDGTNKTSSLTVPVTAGKNYLIGVDGRNGAFGKVVLNYNLNATALSGAPRITNVGTTNNNMLKFRITSITNKFVIQVSTNLTAWTPLSTNPAPIYLYDFVDPRSTNFPRRFYRVQTVP